MSDLSLVEWLRAGEKWFQPNDLLPLRNMARQLLAAECAALGMRLDQAQSEANALSEVGAVPSLRQIIIDYIASHEGSTSEEIFHGVRASRPQMKKTSVQNTIYRCVRDGYIRAPSVGVLGRKHHYFMPTHPTTQ